MADTETIESTLSADEILKTLAASDPYVTVSLCDGGLMVSDTPLRLLEKALAFPAAAQLISADAMSPVLKKKLTKTLTGILSALREPEFRMSLPQAIDKIVQRLWNPEAVRQHEGLAPLPPASLKHGVESLRRKCIVKEALLAAGKTRLIKDVTSLLTEYGLEAVALEEEYVEEVLDNFYEDPVKNAYGTQLFFTRTRANTNSIAQALIGRQPTLRHIDPNTAGTALIDRSALGDIIFALVNYLSGNMSNKDFGAVLASMPKDLSADVILFIDVSPRRAKFVAEKLRCRPNEKYMPLGYLEQLRLAHCALFRALGALGAPVLLSHCDDACLDLPTFEQQKQLPFIDAEDCVRALVHCPSGDVVKELWAQVPEFDFEASSPAHVAEVMVALRERYASHSALHADVRKIAHVKAAQSP